MMMRRRISAFLLAFLSAGPMAVAAPLNIVLITADDMNWDSVGCNGSKVPNITPHIDRLATEGILFREAHATVPVCQPVRAAMSTGLYPHRSGCVGFMPIRDDVTTFNEVLHDAGYLISMLGKNPHYQPYEKWRVDYEVLAAELRVGRCPQKFTEHTRRFLQMAREQGKPFFHHINSQDPHRPFLWNGESAGNEGTFPGVSRVIRPDEVEVPPFLDDLPEIRQELADYFTCVHRLDEVVGAVMKELEEAGVADNTLVMFFGGDHGMPLPFAKSNLYRAGTRSTLILRWPGRISAGKTDERHLVSAIDFAPTLLEAAGLKMPGPIDGRSFLSVAKGGVQEGRDHVITVFHEVFGRRTLEMRCVRTRDMAYIWNAWSDGEKQYRAENMSGLTWRAMLDAAENDPAMRARCDHYLMRVPEEFYVIDGDPGERNNRIDDPAVAADVKRLRGMLAAWVDRMEDPMRGEFPGRE